MHLAARAISHRCFRQDIGINTPMLQCCCLSVWLLSVSEQNSLQQGTLFDCLFTFCSFTLLSGASSFFIFIILMTAIASVFGSLLFGGGGTAAYSVYQYTGELIISLKLMIYLVNQGRLWTRYVAI